MKRGTDEYYVRLANKLGAAALAKSADYPAGCVIVKDGKIIARAKDEVKMRHDVTAHAELRALSKAHKKIGLSLRGCTLYTNIEPCPMCGTALVYSRIKKVVYGALHKELGELTTFDMLKQNGLGKDVDVVQITGQETAKAAEMLSKYVWPPSD